MDDSKTLRFALFGNVHQEKKSVAVQKILSVLSERGAEVAIAADFMQFLDEGMRVPIEGYDTFEDHSIETDYVICMGGDGTFLDVAGRVADKEIPILGINTGRLGFLASFSPEQIDELVADIYADRVDVVDHSVLALTCDEASLEGYPFALNEIAVLKHDSSSMISIRACIDGEYLTTYQADGLIVGTPTGSTAYSLSVGGPIVVPQCQTITLTPVAPHSLNMRPVVLCDDCEVELTVSSRSGRFLIAVDGRSQSYPDQLHLCIRRAPYVVKVVRRRGDGFYATLRKKLMWGTDLRR